jgi:hypothetical protein
MVWELVLQGADLSLEVLFLLPGRDPAVDSSLGDDWLFRFLDGKWQVVDSSGHLDTRDVISPVATSSGVECNRTIFGPFTEGGCCDTELVSSFPGRLCRFFIHALSYGRRWGVWSLGVCSM